MSCSIIRKPNGVVEVTEDVQLFNELVQETGSQLAALDMWAVAQMDEFQQAGYEKTAKDVRVFLDNYASTLNSLSPSETFEVKSFMRENGISTLSELHDILTDVFKPEGEFVVDFNRMIQSGLYNESDLAVFDEDVVMDLMSKIESSEDFFVDVNVEAMYTDTETKTVFGTSSKITENDIYRELMGTVENFQDEASISAAVNELGYSDFTEKFNTDKKFAGEIIEKLSQMKRVPVLHIENGQLTDENLNTKKTVDATLLVGLDTLSLEADIEYLSEISPEIWQSKIENVRGVVKGIEASLVDMNVDVIGISQVIERRDDIIDLLLAAQAMLTNPTPGNIREFASRKDDLVPTDNNSVVLNLPEQYRSLNIVRLSTDKSQAELFEEFGLLKVGPSLYHKVDKTGDFVTGAYELLYQRVLDGTLEIPKEFKLAPKDDKTGVLEDLSKFVMSRNVGFKTLDHELASLSQLVFNHESVDKAKLIEKASQASTIKSDIDYLKGDFVTDFYNYYLEQKLANTSLYRNVLSKFEFKENDITLREPVFSRDMKFFQELQDYMKLKVDMGVDIDVDYKPFFVDEDIRVINNPEIISEYPGQTFQNGNYLVAKANNTQYVKKDGELYRRVLKGDNSTVFAKIQTSPGAVYMQVGNNFDINVEEAQQVLDVYDKEFKTSLTVEQYKDKLKKAGTDGTIKAQMKEFEISSVDDKPGMSVMRVGDSQVFFRDKVNPDGSTTNQIELDLITTKEGKRDKGSGRKALQTFLNYTDSLGKDVYLFAQPRDKQTTVEGLINFYKSEGFKSTSEFLPEEMIRRAKSSTKRQVIGESAVLSQQESDSLRQAKQMELQGEDSLTIELQTGWFKEAGKWKMFSRETLEAFKIKSGVDIDSVKTLSQLIDNPALFRLYPDLKNQKVVFYDENTEGISEYEKKSSLGFQRGGVIYINKLRDSLGQLPISLLGPRASGIADSTLREELESGVSSELRLARFNEQLWMSTLAHELSHILQDKEGFPRGGSIRLFEGVTRAVLPGITNQGLGRVKEHYEENKKLVPESDRPVVEAYVEVIDNFLKYGKDIPKSTYQKYMLLIGEVDARTIEFALNSGEVSSDTPFSALRDRLLELEGLSGQNLIPYTTNQEVTSAVVDKLKQTGLATDVVQMSTQEIEAKLKELGFDDNVVQQVIAWHGTQNKSKDLSLVDFKNEQKYGELLSGTYYGNKSIAAGFAGMFDGSTLFKAQIDESSFAEVDMQGTTPTGTQELVEVIGQEAYDKLLDDKRSGKIKGLILKNSFEKDYPVGTTTQYLVFDPAVVQVMDKFVGSRLDNEVFDVFGIALQMNTPAGEVVKLTPQGFVHNKVVYLNTEAVDPINTSVHEFGHLYLDALKENFTDKYNAGLSLVDKHKDSEAKEYIEYVKTTQPNLKEGTEAFNNEVLAQVIGDNGAKLVNSKKKGSIKEWLSDLWNSIKELVGLSNMTAEQVANMSLQEFAEAVSVDLLSGENFISLQNNLKVRIDEQSRDRGRWDSNRGPKTLEGAPIIEGATGADPILTIVAEEYAKAKGINYRRQSKYVEIDEDRAKRLAQAYDEMEHNPQDPIVKESYQNLINQTVEQYKFLQSAGYRFYFFDETNDPYEGNPWNAMRDLRNNKVMGVFATEAGFGTGNEGLDVSDNPMLQDTGILWPWGNLEGQQKRVLANDLFRAVHDAFGHGLEGAGFRARGEENAWQAHARLFTGSALAAITSETRGQNSWLNFGKYGELNQTAKVEDTMFAPQKTGLMPEWTWQEGFDAGVDSLGRPITVVYRGEGNNFAPGTNTAFTWVALSRETAINYGQVSEIEAVLPYNPFRPPYKTNVDVRSSDIATLMLNELYKKVDTNDVSTIEAEKIVTAIEEYEKLAGNNLEKYHTKISKPVASNKMRDILEMLGFDGIFIPEGDGTFAIFNDDLISRVYKSEQQPVTAFQYQAPPTSNPIMTEKYRNQDIDGVASIIDNNIEFLFNVDEGLISELDCQI